MASLLLTSCGGELGSNAPENMPEELKQTYIDSVELSLESLKDGEESLSTYLNLGFAYQMLEEGKKAKKYYELALELDVNNYKALNNMADLYEDEEDYEIAAEYIKRLYASDPSSANVISKTVSILLKAGDTASALEALENFARLRSGDTDQSPLISSLYEEILNAEATDSN